MTSLARLIRARDTLSSIALTYSENAYRSNVHPNTVGALPNIWDRKFPPLSTASVLDFTAALADSSLNSLDVSWLPFSSHSLASIISSLPASLRKLSLSDPLDKPIPTAVLRAWVIAHPLVDVINFRWRMRRISELDDFAIVVDAAGAFAGTASGSAPPPQTDMLRHTVWMLRNPNGRVNVEDLGASFLHSKDISPQLAEALLQKKGIQASRRDKNGNTPLHVHVLHCRKDVVKLLVGTSASRCARSAVRHKSFLQACAAHNSPDRFVGARGGT
eukprot:m.188061 g.188061  ORF g.188061 m.188061 type:complete len:274 (-) comp10021_c2_seq2:230-1051(-)